MPGGITKEIMKVYEFMRMAVIGGVALCLSAPLAQAQQSRTSRQAQRGQFSDKDYRFVQSAAEGGLEEVQLGQLAQQKGVSQAVRSFGERMAADHGKANNELQQLASQKGAALPSQLSHSENSTLRHLQNAKGADFDKAYARDMVSDHKKDIREFERAAKDVSDPQLRAWIQQTLPVLEQHLTLAEQMEASVRNGK